MGAYDSKDIMSVLVYIRHTYGLEAFAKRGQLAALISDLAPALNNERKLIDRMDKLGILEEFALETDSSDFVKKRLITKSIELLNKNEYIQREIAVEYSITVAKALGWGPKAINVFSNQLNKGNDSTLPPSNKDITGASVTLTKQPHTTTAQLPTRDKLSDIPKTVSYDTTTTQTYLPTITGPIKDKIKHPGWMILSCILLIAWLILSYNELFVDPSSIGFLNFLVVICLLTLLGVPVHLLTLAFSDEWRTGTENWFYWGIGVLAFLLLF